MPFTIERNDLAAVEADAIVVAANERLEITGGVGAAVARAAGFEQLQAACSKIGFCPCGSAVATPAFALKANMVIHAVGPVWVDGAHGEAALLRSAYDSALDCAAVHGAQSIALPLLSAGTYGFPVEVSLAVARESVRAFLNLHDGIDVLLVLYSRESVSAGMAAYLDISEYIDDTYVDARPNRRSAVPGSPAARRSRFAGAKPPTREYDAHEPKGSSFHICETAESGQICCADALEADAGDASAVPLMAASPMPSEDLKGFLDSLDAPFSSTLLALIDERGMTDAQVYKRANMSRQLFSKIRSDAAYRPTKKTALALAVALELGLDETNDLLARAGFTLSHSSKADVIVEYFITRNKFDIFEINEALYAFDQPLL